MMAIYILDFKWAYGCDFSYTYVCLFQQIASGLLILFASPKKNQKRSPEIEYSPISGLFPDLAFLLLWLVHRQFYSQMR